MYDVDILVYIYIYILNFRGTISFYCEMKPALAVTKTPFLSLFHCP